LRVGGDGAALRGQDGPIPVADSDLQMTVDWTTRQHAGAATPITAQGRGADKLGRVQQNTDVHDYIQEAMGFKKAKKAKRKGR